MIINAVNVEHEILKLRELGYKSQEIYEYLNKINGWRISQFSIYTVLRGGRIDRIIKNDGSMTIVEEIHDSEIPGLLVETLIKDPIDDIILAKQIKNKIRSLVTDDNLSASDLKNISSALAAVSKTSSLARASLLIIAEKLYDKDIFAKLKKTKTKKLPKIIIREFDLEKDFKKDE